MQPLTFGTSERPLFGLYQSPRSGPPRDNGVVLCHPMGHEYIHTYPAMKQLAQSLSLAGFHVLRFDYYGSGDSSGETGEGDVSLWCADVEAAIEEIKDSARVTKVCVVGLRLGATLAALVGSKHKAVDRIILWEPIIRGSEYLGELATLSEEYLRRVLPVPKSGIKNRKTLEVLGFPVSSSLRSSLEELDLLSLDQSPATDVLIIAQADSSSGHRLQSRLQDLRCRVDYLSISEPKVWERGEGLESVVVPTKTVNSIVTWCAER